MTKKYSRIDFLHFIELLNGRQRTVRSSNDDVSRVYGEQELLRQRAAYHSGFRIPAIANDDPIEQGERSEALLKQYLILEARRSKMRAEEYQKARAQLQRGMLTLCRDPACSASPTAMRLREKLSKGVDRDQDR